MSRFTFTAKPVTAPEAIVTPNVQIVALERLEGKLDTFLRTFNPEHIREAKHMAACIRENMEPRV